MVTGENKEIKRVDYFLRIFIGGIIASVLGGLVASQDRVFAQEQEISQSNDKTDVFILQQIIEIKDELRDLRQEMSELRKAVDESPEKDDTPKVAAPVNVPIEADDPVLGDKQAKIAIVEFTDYECPFCESYHSETFPQIKKAYVDTGKVQYILRDFPLGFHDQAKPAAIAANCAGQQNAYWKMNDILFTKQAELGKDLYTQSAESLGLNMDQFLSCLKRDEQEQEVTADLTYGQQIGINGTPTFFVGRIREGQLANAKEIGGAQGMEVFEEILETLLKEDTP